MKKILFAISLALTPLMAQAVVVQKSSCIKNEKGFVNISGVYATTCYPGRCSTANQSPSVVIQDGDDITLMFGDYNAGMADQIKKMIDVKGKLASKPVTNGWQIEAETQYFDGSKINTLPFTAVVTNNCREIIFHSPSSPYSPLEGQVWLRE